MKIWALSDIHADYRANRQWIEAIDKQAFQHDILIVAGDISHDVDIVFQVLGSLQQRFKQVCFTAGNHDIWLSREREKSPTDKKNQISAQSALSRHLDFEDSLQKQQFLHDELASQGIATGRVDISTKLGGAQACLHLVPLLSWYDYSFMALNEYLLERWMDFYACKWPSELLAGELEQYLIDKAVCQHLLQRNQKYISELSNLTGNVITYSHCLPRIDIMPEYIPAVHQQVYPVLGSWAIDKQIRQLGSKLHIYGHSHVNRDETIDGVRYVNNAFGAPSEARIARKALYCVWSDE